MFQHEIIKFLQHITKEHIEWVTRQVVKQRLEHGEWMGETEWEVYSLELWRYFQRNRSLLLGEVALSSWNATSRRYMDTTQKRVLAYSVIHALMDHMEEEEMGDFVEIVAHYFHNPENKEMNEGIASVWVA